MSWARYDDFWGDEKLYVCNCFRREMSTMSNDALLGWIMKQYPQGCSLTINIVLKSQHVFIVRPDYISVNQAWGWLISFHQRWGTAIENYFITDTITKAAEEKKMIKKFEARNYFWRLFFQFKDVGRVTNMYNPKKINSHKLVKPLTFWPNTSFLN